jgi:hypothetical protein
MVLGVAGTGFAAQSDIFMNASSCELCGGLSFSADFALCNYGV